MMNVFKKMASSAKEHLSPSSKRIKELEKQVKELEKRLAASEKSKAALEKAAKKEAYYQKRLKLYVNKVVKETGRSYNEVLAHFMDARERTNCLPQEYYIYRFYKLTDEEQEQVFLVDYSKKIIKNYPVSKEFYKMLYDKEKTNEFFPELMGRPWCVNTKISEDDFAARFADTKRIMYKPISGHCGRGVEALYVTPENVREVYQTLSTYPEGVVEGYVVQHPRMSSLCPSSVNTIRVVTISSNSHPVIKGTDQYAGIAYTALRVGAGGSIVDNFHSGGMCVGIDMETGKLCTDAADMEGNVYAAHPTTGTVFKGFELPYYKESLELILKTIEEKKIEGYLGWDIAITENGPVLIELNDRPAVALLSAPWANELKGQKALLSRFM